MSSTSSPASNPSDPEAPRGPVLPPQPPVEADRYAVLKNRNFRLYLSCRVVAALGQQMLGIAVGWELYERTHSPAALGIVGLVQIIPLLLLTLPAGHYADNHERRSIILATQLLTAVNCIGLSLVSWYHAPVPWTYVFLFVSGVGRAFLWPASGAFLPQLLPKDQFPRAVAWNSSAFQLAAAVGPAVGSGLIALTKGATVVYTLNIIASLIAFALLWFVRPISAGPAAREKMSLASLRAGFSFVVSTRIIFGTISLDLFAVLLGGAAALLPVYAKDILHVGPERLGFLQGALPVGSACMALFMAQRRPMEHAGRSMLLAVAGFGAATIIFGLSRSFWLSLAMMFVCGAMDNISVIVRQTLVQVLTPDTMRGRVSAINGLFIGTSNQFGDAESGFVAQWLGPVGAVVAGGIGTILVVVATARIWPEIWRYGRLDTSPPPDTRPLAPGNPASSP